MQCPTCGQFVKDSSALTTLTGLRVALDVGHGWGSFGEFDVGAIGNGITEYELNVLTATICADILKSKGAAVFVFNYPKADNARLTLYQKGQRAAAVGANLFVSIHHNAFNGAAQGTETLVHKLANASDVKFAECMQDALMKELMLTNRGVKRQSLGVLSGVPQTVPAILTEGFFIDWKGFNGKIPSELSERYGKGLAAGIERFWPVVKHG